MPEPVSITAAALCIDGLIISLPRPARHGDLLRKATKYTWLTEGERIIQPDEQGFLGSDGQFYTRVKGYSVAFLAGQLKNPPTTLPTGGEELFTELLW